MTDTNTALTGGGLVARTLAEQGVRHLFTLSGGCLTPIYEACADHGIEIIHTRSEAGAGYMADGWARATGDLGVFAVTAGPGVTNSVTALMTSKIAGSPVLLLAGRYPTSLGDMGASQAIDHLPFVWPATKWAQSVTEGDKLREYLMSAFRQAMTGRPGPVFLDFLSGTLMGKQDQGESPPPGMHRTPSRAYPDPQMVEEAVGLLAKAHKPMLVAGSGTFWSGASEEVRRFAQVTGVPVFTSRMGRGAIPADHPLHYGLASLNSNPVAAYASKNCDVLIVVGAQLDYHFEYGRAPYWANDVKVVQIDIEAEEIGHNRPVNVGIVADAKAALHGMEEAAAGNVDPETFSEWRGILDSQRSMAKGRFAALASSSATPIHPLRLLSEIAKVSGPDDTLVVGHGNIDFWGDAYFETHLPGHYLRAGSFGPLGAEIPFGIAAQLARPSNRVIVLVGDGGFGYSAMELETAARRGLPIVVVIGNDSGWGAIRKQQEFYFGEGRAVGTDMRPWHYEKVVEGIGGHGEFVTSPSDLLPALRRALESGLPACVNVLIGSVTCPFIQWNFDKVRPPKEGRGRDV